MRGMYKGKELFTLVVTLLMGVVLGILVAHLPPIKNIGKREISINKEIPAGEQVLTNLEVYRERLRSRKLPVIGETSSDRDIIKMFIEIYYDSQVWLRTRWLGIDSTQNPCDNWSMQEIITETRPDFIIETGTYKGGTTLFYATILEKVNENGKIITLDIEPKVEKASRFKIFGERVEVITGDSASPEIVNGIGEQVRNSKVLVTLDSLHTKEHVSKELNLYSKLVSLGSYIVVQDTRNTGVMEAVEEFLENNKNFEVDRTREKFLLTAYPSGYLRRIE